MAIPSSPNPPPNDIANTPESHPAHWRIEYVLRLARDRHGNIQLTLRCLSARVGISARHLGRAFKAHTGSSIRTYLRKIREAEAKRLLADPRRSVKEIADSLGYSETANFVRDFRTTTGKTPSGYRLGLASAAATSPSSVARPAPASKGSVANERRRSRGAVNVRGSPARVAVA